MKHSFFRGSVAALLLTVSAAASADSIVVTPLSGGDDGGQVGNGDVTYDMTLIPGGPLDENDCLETPEGLTGQICFVGVNGSDSDVRYEEIGDGEGEVDWWQYAHDGVFVTNQNYLEILLPAGTRAMSIWTGASFNALAWIQGANGEYTTSEHYFRINDGVTAGYAVFAANSCETITSVIVDPLADWGVGNLSISQDPCASVPEPGPLALLMMGILGLGISRMARKA